MNLVEKHYAKPGLLERVKQALALSGLNPEDLRQAEIAKLDQFHVGGLEATDALIRLANIQPTDAVLDLGSGIGGPSRHLASTVGCHVTGVDLTDEYCRVATMLARSTGLSRRVSYQQGDALSTPFADAVFDVVWTQHAAMNIEDKAGLYREISRLLKKGGRLALHDVVAGAGPVLYPVPWASRPELSFLMTEPDMQAAIAIAGLRHIVSQDVTSDGVAALARVAARAGSPGFSLRTLMEDEFPVMIANLTTNLKSGTLRLVQSVYEK
jgi:SAM-dependent methyltransferase